MAALLSTTAVPQHSREQHSTAQHHCTGKTLSFLRLEWMLLVPGVDTGAFYEDVELLAAAVHGMPWLLCKPAVSVTVTLQLQ
jgi:hypothetical protein